MCQRQQNENLKVGEIYQPSDFVAHEADSMEELGRTAPAGFAVIPIVDYSRKYIGGLLPKHFVQFQNAYFKNLRFEDRGNEFVMDQTDSDIHFVPIDRVSRYLDKSIQPVGLDDSIAQTENILVEHGILATPVFDADNQIVGTVSLLDIARARVKKNCCKSRLAGITKTANLATAESRCMS